MYDHLDHRDASEPRTPMVGDDVDGDEETTPMLGTDPPEIPDDAATPMVGGENDRNRDRDRSSDRDVDLEEAEAD